MGVKSEGQMEAGMGLRGARWNSGRKLTTPKLMYLCVAVVILLVLTTGWSWPLPSTPRGSSQVLHQPEIPIGSLPHRFGSLVHSEAQFAQEVGRTMMLPQPQQALDDAVEERASVGERACDGRRVYTYALPASMNTELLERCGGELVNWINFCNHYTNYGFGAELVTADAKFHRDWYGTDAYMLDVIYYERMKRYACLTTDPQKADLFYIPYFAGLDALPHLYHRHQRLKPQGQELVAWLSQNAAESLGRYRGHDHFYVAGRTAWDFSDNAEKTTGWGTTLYANPELENVTSLVLERRPWRDTEQAIPYPVGFHPSSSASLQSWIEVIKSSPRPYLFSFSGALRPQMSVSIRGILSQQCTDAGSACTRLDCARIKCSHEPEPIYTSLLNATFCLQPRGDTATRRSVIDSIVAGCIPVFFHEDTAKTQYRMHLPNDYEKFSVFIPEGKVKDGSAKVQRILETYTPQQVQRMRVRLITIMPHLLYQHPMSMDSMHDAFDATLAGLAKRAAAFKAHSP